MSRAGELKIDVDTAKAEATLEGAREALARLEAKVADPPQPKVNIASKGPRNLPKPSERKRRRTEQRASRRANR